MKILGSLAVLLVSALAFAASPATADTDPAFVRAFGSGVAGGTGFENCTVAADCVPGVSGQGAGENTQTADVAFDPHGGLLVADYGNYRINRYLVGPNGNVTFDRTFGYGVQNGAPPEFQNCSVNCRTGEAGAEAGALNLGWKMTFDAQGRLLVSEFNNNRVSRFLIDLDGTVTFDRAFGFDVNPTGGSGGLETCTTTTTCQPGQTTLGAAAGELGGPDGIAIDAAGGILVGEYTNRRVTRFTVAADGTPTFDRAFGLDVIPGGGTGFENCTAASGCGQGSAGTEAGAVNNNYTLDAAPDGRIFAVAYSLNRVDVFTRGAGGAYSFQQAFGEDVIPGGGTGFETCTASTGCKAGAATGAGGSLDGSSSAEYDPVTGGVFSTADDDNRITHFKPDGKGGFAFDYVYGAGVAGGTGPETCRANCQIGELAGGVGGAFRVSQGSEVRGSRLYVADYDNQRVQVLDIGPAVTVTKKLAPADDAARFDLKVGNETVVAGAGDGDSGATRVPSGSAVTVSETPAGGVVVPSDYDSKIDCGSGATAGTSLTVPAVTADLSCLITNTRKAPVPPPSKAKFTKLVLKPTKKKVKAGKKIKLTVKVTNTGGTKGTATVQLKSSAKKKASAPKKVKVTVPAGKTVSKKFTVKTKKRKKGKVKIKAKLGKLSARTLLTLKR